MSKSSQQMESFSRFVIAIVAASCILGGAAWAFISLDNHGCGGGIQCRTDAQMAQTHY